MGGDCHRILHERRGQGNEKGAVGTLVIIMHGDYRRLLVDLVIGAARVKVAIGTGFEAVLAAEVEVLVERIADRPLAGVLR